MWSCRLEVFGVSGRGPMLSRREGDAVGDQRYEYFVNSGAKKGGVSALVEESRSVNYPLQF